MHISVSPERIFLCLSVCVCMCVSVSVYALWKFLSDFQWLNALTLAHFYATCQTNIKINCCNKAPSPHTHTVAESAWLRLWLYLFYCHVVEIY